MEADFGDSGEMRSSFLTLLGRGGWPQNQILDHRLPRHVSFLNHDHD